MNSVPILTLALFSTLGCEALMASRVQSRAQRDACKYTSIVHPHWTHPVVLCQGVDSDEDGYVRCTVGDGGDITESIECRTSLMVEFYRGCVPMRSLKPGIFP